MEGTPYSLRKASSCPESFVSATGGRSSDSLLEAGRLPERMAFSGIMASAKSSQQRELSGICTRFPIKPCGHRLSAAKIGLFLIAATFFGIFRTKKAGGTSPPVKVKMHPGAFK